jgi:hypothetical protein
MSADNKLAASREAFHAALSMLPREEQARVLEAAHIHATNLKAMDAEFSAVTVGIDSAADFQEAVDRHIARKAAYAASVILKAKETT